MGVETRPEDAVIATSAEIDAWLAREFPLSRTAEAPAFEAVWKRLQAETWNPPAARRGPILAWGLRAAATREHLTLSGSVGRGLLEYRQDLLRQEVSAFASTFFEFLPEDRRACWEVLQEQSSDDPLCRWWLSQLQPLLEADVALALQEPGPVGMLARFFCELVCTNPREQERCFSRQLKVLMQAPGPALKTLLVLCQQHESIELLDLGRFVRLRNLLIAAAPEVWYLLGRDEISRLSVEVIKPTHVTTELNRDAKERRSRMLGLFGLACVFLFALVREYAVRESQSQNGPDVSSLVKSYKKERSNRRTTLLLDLRSLLQPLTRQFIFKDHPQKVWTADELQRVVKDLERSESMRLRSPKSTGPSLRSQLDNARRLLHEISDTGPEPRPPPPPLPE